MKIIKHDAGVFGIPEWAGNAVPGYDLADDDSRLPREIPNYVFRREVLRLLNFVWGREITRAATSPRLGLLLNGPKGSGKTTVVEQFFQRLRVPVFTYTANRATEVQDVLESRTLVDGSIIPIEGPLLLAMRMGCPFVMNEVNLMDPSVLTGFNDVIERGIATTSSGVVHAARGFLFFATSNDIALETPAYGGTNSMNHAFLSRFVAARIEYPEQNDEVDILVKTVARLPQAVASKLVEVARLVRTSEAISTTFSTRELINWGEMIVAFRGLSNAGEDPVMFTLDAAIGNLTDAASRETMRQLTQRVFGASSAAGVTSP